MNTTAVHIDTRLYNDASEYAHRHNTSIDKMMENYLVALVMPTAPKQTIKRPTQMIRLFLDTNILLDFFLARTPFLKDALLIAQMGINNNVLL